MAWAPNLTESVTVLLTVEWVAMSWSEGTRLAARWKWVLILQGAAVVAIVIAHFCSMGQTNLTMRVTAETVEFQLSPERAWTWLGRLSSKEHVSLAHVATLESALFGTIQAPSADAWMTIDGAPVFFDRLSFGTAGLLNITVSEQGRLQLSLRGSDVSGQLQVLGEPVIAAGTTAAEPTVTLDKKVFNVPEVVVFRAAGGPTATMLHLSTESPATFKDLPVTGLTFQREVPGDPGDRRFESTIQAGSLLLTDISRELRLEERQDVQLEGVAGRVVSLVVGSSVDLLFVGTAKRVRTGYSGSLRNVTPKWLEWSYYHITENVLLLAVPAVMVLLWKISQFIQQLRGKTLQ